MIKEFYSHGKLLLSGEYAVLDGALALALPTRLGQSMTISPGSDTFLEWRSLDPEGNIWFRTTFSMVEIFHGKTTSEKDPMRKRLLGLLQVAREMNRDFLDQDQSNTVTTRLEFNPDWGLGSSSTLTANLAAWSGTDVFKLYRKTFGGSGYDIACALNNGPIIFQRREGRAETRRVSFSPTFKDQLYFIHLNKKQDSREAISAYRRKISNKDLFVSKISELTQQILEAPTLKEFEQAIGAHETLVSEALGIPTVGQTRFPDYPGRVKSLGAWGGDFILATGREGVREYFRAKGYTTLFTFSELIL